MKLKGNSSSCVSFILFELMGNWVEADVMILIQPSQSFRFWCDFKQRTFLNSTCIILYPRFQTLLFLSPKKETFNAEGYLNPFVFYLFIDFIIIQAHYLWTCWNLLLKLLCVLKYKDSKYCSKTARGNSVHLSFPIGFTARSASAVSVRRASLNSVPGHKPRNSDSQPPKQYNYSESPN